MWDERQGTRLGIATTACPPLDREAIKASAPTSNLTSFVPSQAAAAATFSLSTVLLLLPLEPWWKVREGAGALQRSGAFRLIKPFPFAEAGGEARECENRPVSFGTNSPKFSSYIYNFAIVYSHHVIRRF